MFLQLSLILQARGGQSNRCSLLALTASREEELRLQRQMPRAAEPRESLSLIKLSLCTPGASLSNKKCCSHDTSKKVYRKPTLLPSSTEAPGCPLGTSALGAGGSQCMGTPRGAQHSPTSWFYFPMPSDTCSNHNDNYMRGSDKYFLSAVLFQILGNFSSLSLHD